MSMRWVCFSFLGVLAAAGLAVGQTFTSEITGTVRDSTGAVTPGASVTAINEATGVTYKQATTQAGVFSFPSLPVGSYTIAVELKGFKSSRTTHNLLIEIGRASCRERVE